MSKFNKIDGPIRFLEISRRDVPSSKKPNDSYNLVKFETPTEHGVMIYYDTVSKRNDEPTAQQFHNDIMAAAEGSNSGLFEGLTFSQSDYGVYYIQASKNYSVVPVQ